ncbi:tRNA-specific adenosine-34 deaminase [Clostridiaceae bacterium JG1575]|nr:tRNA-specific adenosine-34 deaminase [Clostridiaceae bacterium JG1575]
MVSSPSPSHDSLPSAPDFMAEALLEARKALAMGEIPVGCVVVHEGRIIGRGHNEKERRLDPCAHAEVLAIQQAAQTLKNWRLTGCQLYVTLEPCPMCTSLITQSRIREVTVALHEVQSGAMGTVLDLTRDPLNKIELTVHWDYRKEAQELLSAFFDQLKSKREAPSCP